MAGQKPIQVIVIIVFVNEMTGDYNSVDGVGDG